MEQYYYRKVRHDIGDDAAGQHVCGGERLPVREAVHLLV